MTVVSTYHHGAQDKPSKYRTASQISDTTNTPICCPLVEAAIFSNPCYEHVVVVDTHNTKNPNSPTDTRCSVHYTFKPIQEFTEIPSLFPLAIQARERSTAQPHKASCLDGYCEASWRDRYHDGFVFFPGWSLRSITKCVGLERERNLNGSALAKDQGYRSPKKTSARDWIVETSCNWKNSDTVTLCWTAL